MIAAVALLLLACVLGCAWHSRRRAARGVPRLAAGHIASPYRLAPPREEAPAAVKWRVRASPDLRAEMESAADVCGDQGPVFEVNRRLMALRMASDQARARVEIEDGAVEEALRPRPVLRAKPAPLPPAPPLANTVSLTPGLSAAWHADKADEILAEAEKRLAWEKARN